ncbi:hypothetical protein ACLI4Z_14465 [Natrialbaceae archaeon A-arb3/5]
MTRFDATEPVDRRKLYVDAITAHRKRNSGFVTLEIDEESIDAEAAADGTDASESETDSTSGPNPELGVPWIQFGDGTINLDCTADELEELKALLSEFPAFKIDDLTRPEEVDGINVRVSAKADPNRISQFIDAAFQQVYGLPVGFKVWVVEI